MSLRHPSFFASLVVVCSLLSAVPAVAETERFRTMWRGQWVDYIEVGEFAVTDGDIIIGPKEAVRDWTRAVERGLEQFSNSQKALTTGSAAKLWQRAASGVVEVPYTIEAGNAVNINGAVAEANRVLAGVLQWVPRTTQPDYVAFNMTAVNSGGACYSWVGRVGGRQEIFGDSGCPVWAFIHEMGHAMGLWHVQQDDDSGTFVDIKLDRMDPSLRSASLPPLDTQTIGGYDYASIMHYGRGTLTGVADYQVLETRPAGIDILTATTYSRVDVDALRRLYGAASQRTTVNSHPEGLRVVVDGVAVTTPADFDWAVGSVHRVWVPPGLQSSNGYSFAFARWSHDASAVPSTQLTWQVSAGDGSLGTPSTAPSASVITANFSRLINVSATPATQLGGRTIVKPRAAAWPGTTSLYPQFTIFDVTTDPAAGYFSYSLFDSGIAFNGGLGLRPGFSVSISASLPTQIVGANFHNGATIAVDVIGDGILDGIALGITAPGGAFTNSYAPRISRNTQGTWKYTMSSPQYIGLSIRHILDGYDGFDNAATGTVTMPLTGVRNVSIRAHRELAPYKQVIPACAGSISLSNSSTWVRFGSSLSAVVVPATNANFVGWSGTASGTGTTVSSIVGVSIPEFTATFNSTLEPLSLTRLSHKVMGDDTLATPLVITGTGFTANTYVVVSGVALTPTFVDSHTLQVNLSRAKFPAAGRYNVYVANNLQGACWAYSNWLAVDILQPGKDLGAKLTEYYYPALDYYFLTGRAGDKAALDAAPTLWSRTGKEIKISAVPTVDTLPLERHYFDKVARGGTRGSHFFTALASEQVLLTSINPTNTQLAAKPFLESVEGYAIPKSAAGTCPANTTPIYRSFKGAPRYVDDGNHRFSTSLAQHQDMVNRLGWIDDGIVFCGLQ